MTADTFTDDPNKHFESSENTTYDGTSTENEPYNSGLTVYRKTRNNKGTLRLTEYRKTWVLSQVRKYAEQIGITEEDMPNSVFSRIEVLAMPKELTAGTRTVTHTSLGIYFHNAKTIFINVKYHTSFEHLRDTIVHELVHYRFRYLRHGRRFEYRISLIVEGKRYKIKSFHAEKTAPLPSLHSQDDQNQLEIHSRQSSLLIVKQKHSCNNNTLYNNACSEDDVWTTECFVDELFLSLVRIKECITNDRGRTIQVRKYYNQARHLMKRIPIENPLLTLS